MKTGADGKIFHEGEVIDLLKGALFRVRFDDGREALSHLSGKMRLHHIKVVLGDRVRVEFSPYDETRGRIIERL
ncbi:MAG: translation initiation factor IF-1 [Candidatus Ryanbacteria bacterium RIFCSPHIGHO2_02_FULL_45_43]|uniref:Translation initiation factor IF-1 n=1 Tax=Candidatus Ryanbacteria bacterium RIFCSPHIGHO2_01_45_13 TaxID=1802112 RepID=A0A1G2FXW3_9BACT|nr:MAG: translation initiation factor IF-1 [Candidatus Ryanbacteria bacterium RIFCSPHIGHO2_01_FULL_44_130]OGZ42924.1 MAG: translation initiation factor IF-1 [Candidatus Ryanbacteria bacterium RIFCSPHIGHO2_01_45_13]OGZ48629.1 MAG: translation initiation factor IF-1 [Candidatus Ryanbacteria bacterium RIFCSPHIGHO2_02_FULL_45_43]OGZ50570.1 MAG: translation initiation factor IF-1 [Candidatus Ryanbacteria bacterium RIFCSPHIGHO2_12_FULL_44_20]OGZ51876.1 MAG: translation initiation factor IF-1 [Candida